VFAPVAFSADGKLVAIGGVMSGARAPGEEKTDAYRQRKADAEAVRVWDVATQRQLAVIKTGQVWFRSFTPDGRYLVIAGREDLRLWEVATGKEVLRRPVHEPYYSAMAQGFACSLAVAPDGRAVATGLADTNVLVWDLAPATRHKREVTADDLDRLWADLAGEDARKAYHAAGTLSATAERAVQALAKRLRPVAEDAAHIRRLIADLDSEKFETRQSANEELKDRIDVAEPYLRKTLEGRPSAELRRGLTALLESRGAVLAGESLRRVRAVAVLEQVGSAEARAVLEDLAKGAPAARQTREAQAALRRLASRSTNP
jgi:hypothetical protein